jgi:hypothetical protein
MREEGRQSPPRPGRSWREAAHKYASLVAGTFSGVVQAGLFNPYDRALYLSVRDQRPFVHVGNFVEPFRGFSQAVVQRTIAGGLYFVLQVGPWTGWGRGWLETGGWVGGSRGCRRPFTPHARNLPAVASVATVVPVGSVPGDGGPLLGPRRNHASPRPWGPVRGVPP